VSLDLTEFSFDGYFSDIIKGKVKELDIEIIKEENSVIEEVIEIKE